MSEMSSEHGLPSFQAPSAAPLPEAASFPTAAAPATSAPPASPLLRERRDYGWGPVGTGEGGLFSGDTFASPTATSSPFSLFSDPVFPAQPIPSPRAPAPSVFETIPLRSAPQSQTFLIEDPLTETLTDLGFLDVPLTEEEGDASEVVRAVVSWGLDDGETVSLAGGETTRKGDRQGGSSQLADIGGGGLFSSDAFVPPAGASSPFSLFSEPEFFHEPIPSPRSAGPSRFESVPLRSSPQGELPDVDTWSGLGFADVSLTEEEGDEGYIVHAVLAGVPGEGSEPVHCGAVEWEAGEGAREEESVGTPGADAAAGSSWVGEPEAAPQVQDSWEVRKWSPTGSSFFVFGAIVFDSELHLRSGKAVPSRRRCMPCPQRVSNVDCLDKCEKQISRGLSLLLLFLQGAVPSSCPIKYAYLARTLPFIPNIWLDRELARVSS